MIFIRRADRLGRPMRVKHILLVEVGLKRWKAEKLKLPSVCLGAGHVPHQMMLVARANDQKVLVRRHAWLVHSLKSGDRPHVRDGSLRELRQLTAHVLPWLRVQRVERPNALLRKNAKQEHEMRPHEPGDVNTQTSAFDAGTVINEKF